MAGGEGTRLRPLTCDCPKPMIRLMNRPVMGYALALLKKHGITRVAATLGYLPDAIRDCFGAGDDFGVELRYSVERAPLGTAGGVRQARAFLDETFIVLSGDGVTDLDIDDALRFHRRSGALATLVLKRTDNPLDYGVVLTDPDGRVRSFHEKPDWSDVVSDTVNTGIYILEPEALDHIPEGRPCDFGHDLFPELVRRGLPVYGYVTQGYWCDIGDVRAYLQAHADAMEGRIRLEGLLPGPCRVVQLPGASVDRSAVLEGPCLIGANARILAGAYVGPYSVIGEDCVVGENASVKRSVLWPGRGCWPGPRAVLPRPGGAGRPGAGGGAEAPGAAAGPGRGRDRGGPVARRGRRGHGPGRAGAGRGRLSPAPAAPRPEGAGLRLRRAGGGRRAHAAEPAGCAAVEPSAAGRFGPDRPAGLHAPFQRDAPAVEAVGGTRAAYVAEAAPAFTADPKAAPPVALYAEPAAA